MATVRIYGSSDDLVEVEGDVPGCDEYGSYNRPLYVELSTRDVFRVEYTNCGVWSVVHVEKNPTSVVTLEPHGEGDDPEPDTDTVTVSSGDENLVWVEPWPTWPPRDGDIANKVCEVFGVTESDVGVPLTRLDYLALWGVIRAAKHRRGTV